MRVFPLKGHEITGCYVYRAMLNTNLLEVAFVAGIDPGFTGKFDKTQFHEFGGYWQWTLNPYFDIRLAGNAAFLGDGYKDLAQLSDCNTSGPASSPVRQDRGAEGEARFRARF